MLTFPANLCCYWEEARRETEVWVSSPLLTAPLIHLHWSLHPKCGSEAPSFPWPPLCVPRVFPTTLGDVLLGDHRSLLGQNGSFSKVSFVFKFSLLFFFKQETGPNDLPKDKASQGQRWLRTWYLDSAHGFFQYTIWTLFCGLWEDPQLRLGVPHASGHRGPGLPFSSFTLCSGRFSGSPHEDDLPTPALLEGTGTPDICPPAVGPWLWARKPVKLKAFCSHLYCLNPTHQMGI